MLREKNVHRLQLAEMGRSVLRPYKILPANRQPKQAEVIWSTTRRSVVR
jgi:hypothetical protein